MATKAFPRGSKQTLRKAYGQTQNSIPSLFQSSSSTKPLKFSAKSKSTIKTQPRKKRKLQQATSQTFPRLRPQRKNTQTCSNLYFSSIKAGNILSGTITQYLKTENAFLISFSNALCGQLPLSKERSDLSSLKIGQRVTCVVRKVMELGVKHKVIVDVDFEETTAHLINKVFTKGVKLFGKVLSKEDHGYILQLSKSKKGFISFEKVNRVGNRLQVGEILQVLVERTAKFSGRKEIFLKMDDGKENFDTFASFEQFVPGTEINGQILSYFGDNSGFKIRFGSFEAFCPVVSLLNNLKNELFEEEIQGSEKKVIKKLEELVGQKFLFRVLALDRESKEIIVEAVRTSGLTKDELLDLAMLKGKLLSSLKVALKVPNGCFIFAQDDEISFLGFIPKSKDTKLTEVISARNEVKAARCIALNVYDQVFQLSANKKSLISDQDVFSYDDLSIGKKMIVRIAPENYRKHINSGVIVNFGLNYSLKGFIPKDLLSDLKRSVTGYLSKHRQNEEIEVRVWKIENKESKERESKGINVKVVFVAKASLINSNLPVFEDLEFVEGINFEQDNVVVDGVVSKINGKAGRVFITLYGKFWGIIEELELAEYGVSDPLKSFEIGQPLRLRILKILSVDEVKESAKFKFSLITATNDGPNEIEGNQKQLGSKVTGKIVAIENELFQVEIELDDSKVNAILPFANLTDRHLKHSVEKLNQNSYVDQEFSDLFIVDYSSAGKPILTNKPSFQQFLSKKEDFAGFSLGYVSSFQGNGVNVKLFSELTKTVLVPNANIASSWVSKPNENLHLHQTVVVEHRSSANLSVYYLDINHIVKSKIGKKIYTWFQKFVGEELIQSLRSSSALYPVPARISKVGNDKVYCKTSDENEKTFRALKNHVYIEDPNNKTKVSAIPLGYNMNCLMFGKNEKMTASKEEFVEAVLVFKTAEYFVFKVEEQEDQEGIQLVLVYRAINSFDEANLKVLDLEEQVKLTNCTPYKKLALASLVEASNQRKRARSYSSLGVADKIAIEVGKAFLCKVERIQERLDKKLNKFIPGPVAVCKVLDGKKIGILKKRTLCVIHCTDADDFVSLKSEQVIQAKVVEIKENVCGGMNVVFLSNLTDSSKTKIIANSLPKFGLEVITGRYTKDKMFLTTLCEDKDLLKKVTNENSEEERFKILNMKKFGEVAMKQNQ
eukprot:snap_masked-scaffold_12-processed-gene-12.50-mRNA-1 protein AED:1.00 eAED:1.00 QI:0/0/0/0/1/1/3/0/1176